MGLAGSDRYLASEVLSMAVIAAILDMGEFYLLARCLLPDDWLRHDFKHLVFFYCHNCLYDFVWQDYSRRVEEPLDIWWLPCTSGSDYHVILVGDAKMTFLRTPGRVWLWFPSIKLINESIGGRMHPLTVAGLTEAINRL